MVVIMLFIAWPLVQWGLTRSSKSLPTLQAEADKDMPILKQMLGAAWHGLTNKNEPFMVTAQRTVQKNPLEFTLETLQAQIETHNTEKIIFRATEGHARKDEKKLFLEKEVSIETTSGYVLKTPTATVDFSQGIAYGDDIIAGHGPLGTIDAHGFEIRNKGELVRFSGNVKVRFQRAQVPGKVL